jgi:hypothetical protein
VLAVEVPPTVPTLPDEAPFFAYWIAWSCRAVSHDSIVPQPVIAAENAAKKITRNNFLFMILRSFWQKIEMCSLQVT